MSGRCGGFVYYWAYGRQCWRIAVIPKDPHTAAQRRSQAAFGAASKAWSQNRPLTEAQRTAWHAAAAMVRSTPRLGLSGFRTAQQHFVGTNSRKPRWHLPLLLEPPPRKALEAEVSQRQDVAQPSSDTRRARTGPPPSSPGTTKARAQQPIGRFLLSQHKCPVEAQAEVVLSLC